MSKSIRLFFYNEKTKLLFPFTKLDSFLPIWHYAGLPSYREKSNNVLSAKRRCTLSPVSYKITRMDASQKIVCSSLFTNFYKKFQKYVFIFQHGTKSATWSCLPMLEDWAWAWVETEAVLREKVRLTNTVLTQ